MAKALLSFLFVSLLFASLPGLAQGCPAKINRGKNIKVLPGESVRLAGGDIRINALGSNRICGWARSVYIVLQRPGQYRVNLSRGKHALFSRQAVQLAFRSRGQSRLRLDGASSAAIFTGQRADFIDIEKSKRVRINSGPGADILNIEAEESRVKTESGADQIFARGDKADVFAGSGSDRVRLFAQKSLIALGRGDDLLRSQGSGSVELSAGRGSDRIAIGASSALEAELGRGNDQFSLLGDGSASRKIDSGSGEDLLHLDAAGTNRIFLRDKDLYYGGTGKDIVTVQSGSGHVVRGGPGGDVLSTRDGAQAFLYGDTGNDRFFASASGQGRDRIYGGRNNDTIYANRGRGSAGAVIDAGQGDDLVLGSSGPDVIFYRSGIKEIYALGGNDLVLRTSISRGLIDLGRGWDIISYAGHTYLSHEDPSRDLCLLDKEPTGIEVRGDRKNGVFQGRSWRRYGNRDSCLRQPVDDIKSAEFFRGSAESDVFLVDGAGVDGIAGKDLIEGKESCLFCGEEASLRLLSVDGIFLLIGTDRADKLELQLDRGQWRFSTVRQIQAPPDRCRPSKTGVLCRASRSSREMIILNMGAGRDSVRFGKTPDRTLSVVALGSGGGFFRGSSGDDLLSVGYGDYLSRMGPGSDLALIAGDGDFYGGAGDDVLHVKQNPCLARSLHGGGGKDIGVFVGSGGVFLNLGLARTGFVEKGLRKSGWGIALPISDVSAGLGSVPEECPSGRRPLRIAPDIESFEGTSGGDYFISGSRRGASFLGRQGPDVYATRNQMPDQMTIHGLDNGTHDWIAKDSSDMIAECFGQAAPPLFEGEPAPGCSTAVQGFEPR